uniref:BED-type domain-containing protein n=1 Tax=Nothobranchius furzeri TaxID=105023 RepID=A0A8C6LG25_NOTFU
SIMSINKTKLLVRLALLGTGCLVFGDWKVKMDKYRKRSVVWSYFKDIDASSVQCLLCSRHLRRKDHGSTTPMLRHLRLKHSAQITLDAEGGGGQMSQSVELDSDQTFSEGGERLGALGGPPFLRGGGPATNGQLDTVQEGSTQQTTNSDKSTDQAVKSTRRRSLIWKHFVRLESLEAAQCRICLKKLQCFESGCTSNLHRHMLKRHPKVCIKTKSSQQLHPSQHSDANNETSVDSSVTRHEQTSGKLLQFLQTLGPISQYLDGLKVAVESEVGSRVFMRERELIEALRRTQREESRTLEHQRELLEKLRSASAREASADREKIEALRKAQQEEADELRRQREELEKEKAELQRKWDELNQERGFYSCQQRGQGAFVFCS